VRAGHAHQCEVVGDEVKEARIQKSECKTPTACPILGSEFSNSEFF
jgi:hypothetical protein